MMSLVTTSLGTSDPPAALRTRAPGWRDPRLWLGVAIVAASVLAGARLLARADDTVPLWAARADLASGDVVETGDLVARRVHFADEKDQLRYLRADQPLPGDQHLLRGVAAGELVPAAALGEAAETGLLTVPLSVPALGVPPDLGPGSHVDVWVTSETSDGDLVSKPLLTGVVVIAAPPSAESFGISGDRQLVLGVAEEQSEALGRTLAAVGEASITVVGLD